MSDIEKLRAQKLRQLQQAQEQRQGEQYENQFRKQQVEEQISHIMRQIMTPEARDRMQNIKLARPDYARQVELLLIQLYQSGRLAKLDDSQLKALLSKISGSKRETKIKGFRR